MMSVTSQATMTTTVTIATQCEITYSHIVPSHAVFVLDVIHSCVAVCYPPSLSLTSVGQQHF